MTLYHAQGSLVVQNSDRNPCWVALVSAHFPWNGGWGTRGVLLAHLPRLILKEGLGVACPPTCNSEERDGVGHSLRFVLYFWKDSEEKGTCKLEDRCYFQNKGRSLG